MGLEVKSVFVQIILTILILSNLGSCTAYPTEEEVTLFQDDFEAYSVGSFPLAGGWEMVWSGQEMVISGEYSYSPNKSFQLWGRLGWSAAAQRKFITNAKIIGYEASLLIESRGIITKSDWFGFFNKDAATWGAYWATVSFDHSDMKIKAGKDGAILGDWAPKNWYKIKVTLDREENTYNIWINNRLVGQNLRTEPNSYWINAIVLKADHTESKLYYDDVRVFYVRTVTAPAPPLSNYVTAALIIGIAIVIGSAIVGIAILYSQKIKCRRKKRLKKHK
jgi:hypothetical protein